MSCAKAKNGSEENKKRVLVVDDHPIVREGLADLINKEKNLVVCGCAEDIPQALEALRTLKPDVVTVDISLKDASGIGLIKNIKAQYPDLPVLAISMHEESLYAERALRAGAKGYITKQQATENVIIAIRNVLQGQLYLSENMKDKLLLGLTRSGKTDIGGSPIESLTDRELEVFTFLGRGKSSRQIAEQLHLSIKTVETYRSRIKDKLNLAGASELLQRAFQWVNEQQKD